MFFSELLLAHSAIVSSQREDSCGEYFAERFASKSQEDSSPRGGQCEACHAASGCCLHRNFVTKPNYLTIISYITYTSINMHSLYYNIIILALLFAPITASSKLLIVGQNRNNNYKFALAQRYAPEIDSIIRDSSASFYVFTQNTCQHNAVVEEADADDAEQADANAVYTQCHQLSMPTGNFSTIVVTQRGTDEMNFSEIELFYNHLDKHNPLLVIEIGDEAIQTTALLKKGSKCWGETSTPIISPNKAFLCNDFQPSMARDLIAAHDVQLIPQTIVAPQPEERAFWPCIFVSASPKSKKSREAPKVHVQIHDEEEDDDNQDDEEEEVVKKTSSYRPHKAPKKAEEKKLECKYRKSCYETGTLPDIDLSLNFWPSSFTWNSDNSDETDDDDDDNDDDDDSENVNRIVAMKLKCKYRLDCYKVKNIPLSLKEQEHNEKKAAAVTSSIESHSSAKSGKKKTLKDIAQKAVKKVKEAEEKAASRPLPKAVKIEKELDKIENEMNKKLRCKYRQSCYESGEIPEIAQSTWTFFSTTSQASDDADDDDDATNTKTYAEMDELEQKVYCKYRKSCYDSGVKPRIEPEIQIRSFRDLKDLPDIVETRKLTIQEKCKYRKSCYATGILPEIHPPVEYVVEQKHISSVVPTSVQDLKHLCKYRKSCYEEIANSGTTDVVKTIRKRRLIEREEKKRRHRRDRLRKRAKGGIEFEEEIILQAAAAASSSEDDSDAPSHHSKKNRRDKKHKSISSNEDDEQPSVTVHSQQNARQESVEAVDEEEEVKKPKKSLKKVKQEVKEEKKPEPKEEEDDDKEVPKVVVVEEDEAEVVEKLPKKSLKKSKAVKKQQVQKENEDEDEEQEAVAVPIPVPVPVPVPVVKEKVAEEKSSNKKSQSKKQAREVKAEKKLKKEVEAKAPKHADDDDDDEHESEYKKKLKQKEFCKYRKSCYETGERPDIRQSISSMYSSFNQHVDKVYDKQKPKSESDQKLDCKYRKSCYDTGRLPDLNIRQTIVIPKLDEIHDKKLHCKYRKSCYDESIDDDLLQSSQQQQQHQKTVLTEKKNQKAAEQTKKMKKADDETKKKAAHHAQNDDDTDSDDDADDDTDDDKNEKQKKKVAHIDAQISGLSLKVDEKLDCKYRKSCYANVKPRSKNEDHSGSMARQHSLPIRTKCNEYYLSCREQLGLSPKEKAPMGPNGRRLCRKKKE